MKRTMRPKKCVLTQKHKEENMLIQFRRKRGRPRKTREEKLEHYKKRYGSFFLHLTDQLAEDHLLTAADIAREFNISREIVRLACNIYYHRGFLKERRNCAEISPLALIYSRKAGLTRQKAFIEFLKLLRKHGLWPVIPGRYRLFSLPDGTTICFKIISAMPKNYPSWGNNTYIRIPLSKPTKYLGKIDFYVVALKNQKEPDFYIFPRSFVSELTQIYLRTGRPSRYEFFKNAWHLLNTRIAENSQATTQAVGQ